MVKVAGFDWDSGNLLKNEAKHGISHESIEALFLGKVWVAPDLKHSHSEDRFLALGRGAGGRPMITFRTKSGLRLIRPISARFMHAREARKYEQAFADNEK